MVHIKETPLRSGRITHSKRFFSKIYIFLLPTYFVYQNLFCGTLLCPRSIWQLGLKLVCICWIRKSVTYAFPRSTDIIQVLNELPTDKIHIKVPQDRLLCPTHVDNKKVQLFEKLFLSVLHDQTSVEFLLFKCRCIFAKGVIVHSRTTSTLSLNINKNVPFNNVVSIIFLVLTYGKLKDIWY